MGKFKLKVRAVPVIAIIIPAVIVLSILHAFIIYSSIQSNYTSRALAASLEEYTEVTAVASRLQGGSSILSETSTSFIAIDGRESGPLLPYIEEFVKNPEKRPDAVINDIKDFPILKWDPEDHFETNLFAARDNAKRMLEVQLRAIKLVLSYAPRTADELYNTAKNMRVDLERDEIAGFLTYLEEEVELLASEAFLPNDAKPGYTKGLIFGAEYSGWKSNVAFYMEEALGSLNAERDTTVTAAAREASFWRTWVWIITVTIIVIMFIVFLTIYLLLVRPLANITDKIKSDDKLDDQTGLYETRFLAYSYNELLKRRNLLEENLRYLAETDALTKLPNRLTFNNRITKIKAMKGTSVAFFSFDINGLKEVNDTKGHLAGDELIMSSAECILNTFGDIERRNCFRIGGDEFAAILTDCPEKAISPLLEKFRQKQKKYGISIAYGYAYSEDIAKTTFENIFIEADGLMYKCKMKMKENGD